MWRCFKKYKTQPKYTPLIPPSVPPGAGSPWWKSGVLIPISVKITKSSLPIQFKVLKVEKEANVLPQRQSSVSMNLERPGGQVCSSWIFVFNRCVRHKASQGRLGLAVTVFSKATCIFSFNVHSPVPIRVQRCIFSTAGRGWAGVHRPASTAAQPTFGFCDGGWG